MEKIYRGEIKARLVDLRFSASGKLAILNKRRGDLVKKGELVASLDKKQLQAELDSQLADYEKVRAEFEIYGLQKGEPTNDVAKYTKTQKQAELNASVKQVELAKAKLDQADLISPVAGAVIDDSDLVVGMNITPASNPIMIVDDSSYYFSFGVNQKEIHSFTTPKKAEVKLDGLAKKITGTTLPIFSSKSGKFLVEIKLDGPTGLLLGLSGQATITP